MPSSKSIVTSLLCQEAFLMEQGVMQSFGERRFSRFFDGIILSLGGIIPSNTVAFEFPSARQVVITTTNMQEAFLMEQGVMQSFGERWFSRFSWTDSFRPSTESYRRLLPPLKFNPPTKWSSRRPIFKKRF